MKLATWSLILAADLVGPHAQAEAPPQSAAAIAAPRPPEAPGATVTPNGRPISERFADLDAYLRHLQARSHLDGAWYCEVRPGVYELRRGNLRMLDEGTPRRTYTRADLERRFGFRR